MLASGPSLLLVAAFLAGCCPKRSEIDCGTFRTATNRGGQTPGYATASALKLLTLDRLGFKALDRNGTLDPYGDLRRPSEERPKDSAWRMSAEHVAGLLAGGDPRRTDANLCEASGCARLLRLGWPGSLECDLALLPSGALRPARNIRTRLARSLHDCLAQVISGPLSAASSRRPVYRRIGLSVAASPWRTSLFLSGCGAL